MHDLHTNVPVYVTDGARTPFLKARGRPGPFSPADLAVCGATACGAALRPNASVAGKAA